MDKFELSSFIKKIILDKGFHAVGITRAEYLPKTHQQILTWLNDGYHGNMEYMAKHMDKRCDASKLVPGAKSIVIMLASYYPEIKQEKSYPQIAKYAYGEDYHMVLKVKMLQVWEEINQKVPTLEGRIFTDSAPIHEKAYAREAGLGWIGKNSCLVTRPFGSFFFICELVINVELVYDAPYSQNHCGNCTRCIEACPTGAIVKPGVIDSQRCISYHTIENKREIPDSIQVKINNQLFGCDICQDVCPWNLKLASKQPFSEFNLNPKLNKTTTEWTALTAKEFKHDFTNSPLSRTGWAGIQRNLKIIDTKTNPEQELEK